MVIIQRGLYERGNTRVMFPGGSLRWIAARLTCVTAMFGWVMMGSIEQGVPSGLCRVWKYIMIRGVEGRGMGGIIGQERKCCCLIMKWDDAVGYFGPAVV